MTVIATCLGRAPQILQRLAGPVLDKELRVTSRKVRYYLLRAGYAAALASMILMIWNSTVQTGPAVVRASRMPEVAKIVTTAVTWLQFLVAQVLAIVLLSSAIGEEVRKGTLSALMTTPITSCEIVVGKLLGRMLQVLMLLAISLPVLAILRLLGGVPWEYILAGGRITLTTALFAGSLSLWLSTHCRYGSRVISTSVLILVVLFVIPMFALSWLISRGVLGPAVAGSIMDRTNPFYSLYEITAALWAPAGPPNAVIRWGSNGLILLSFTLVLLVQAIRRVRKAATEGASGHGKAAGAAARIAKRLLGSTGTTAAAAGPIRHVNGSPVVWKETRRGHFYGWSVSDIVICVIALAAVIVPTLVLDAAGSEPTIGLGLFVSWILSMLVLVRLVVECAGNVPREREARTWPILLTTPLEDKEIVNGKVKAALLHNSPLLITLAVLYLFFLAAFPRSETFMAAGWGLVSLVVSILLVVGIGSYLGVIVKTRSSAIVATIVVCLATKYVIGGMFAFVAAGLAAGINARGGPAEWGFFLMMVIPAAIQVTIAVAAIRLAAQRVRHDVF